MGRWLLLLYAGLGGIHPQNEPQRLARDILQQLIDINTTDSSGNNTQAAQAMAERLKSGGFPAADVLVLGPNERKGNLVVRLRGSGARPPILLLAHLDVVEARREDWSVDPFHFLERDGYFYGRGTQDNKAGVAIFVANLIRYRQERYRPDRDLILALTSDEEFGKFNGVEWLLKNHRELIDAQYCINSDGGDSQMKNGKRLFQAIQAGEKVYISFQLEATNPGGHSSLPVKENAIYRLAGALTRLADFAFPARLSEVTRTFFAQMARVETGETARDMRGAAQIPPDPAAIRRLSESAYYNALLRTTCVATTLQGGHAENALPQRARAVMNCRMLPDERPEDVRQALVRVVADDQISITVVTPAQPGPASPLEPEVVRSVKHVTDKMWPGLPVIPWMDMGASDGRLLRAAGIPTYGISGLAYEDSEIRAHGRDERISAANFYEGQQFLYALVKELSSGGGAR